MNRRPWALPGVLILMAALLAACVGEDPEAGLSVLHRGINTDPESLDPQLARSVQAADVLRDIGEGLATYTANGTIVPGTAESWEVSDEGRKYTFRIRETARWSDGEPVTAADFVHGFQRLVDPAMGAFYAQTVSAIVNARDIIAGRLPASELGVTAIDERTLVIQLENPVPYFLALVTHHSTFPMRADTHSDGDNALSVFNGAYVIDRWEPASSMRLVRNPMYWNDAATSIDIVYHHVLVETAAELNRYRAGELHITSAVPAESFESIRKQYGDQLRISKNLGIYYYGYNLTREPFKDSPELRQALSMAIDRELIVEKVTLQGEVPAYSWVPPGTNNYEPPTFGYAALSQPERNAIAKRLYARAGYGPDNPLEVEIRYNASEGQQRIALTVQSMWRDVLGVETTLVAEEFRVLLESIRARHNTEVFRLSWIGDYNDATTFLDLLITGNAANVTGYSNPEYDRLMRTAAEQLDLDRRRLFLEEAERIMLADHPVIPLYFYVSDHLVSPLVKGWEENVLDYHYSQHLSLGSAE